MSLEGSSSSEEPLDQSDFHFGQGHPAEIELKWIPKNSSVAENLKFSRELSGYRKQLFGVNGVFGSSTDVPLFK